MTDRCLIQSDNIECPLCLGVGELTRAEVLDRLDPSTHQNRQRIVARERAGQRSERPQAVPQVSGGPRVPDRRHAEDWESLHVRPGQMRRAVPFPNPFRMSLNVGSKLSCHVAPSRIPRSITRVDGNLSPRSRKARERKVRGG
jgi:hypothetical protein